jgi:hypothetical protein
MKKLTLVMLVAVVSMTFAGCELFNNNNGEGEGEGNEQTDPEPNPDDNDKPGPGENLPTDEPDDYSKFENITYAETDDIFLNPERGWYTWNGFSFVNGSVPSAITKSLVQQRRNEGFSIMHCIYHLTDFRGKALSQKVLDLFEANMNAIRDGGSKCTLRFSYTDAIDDNNKSIADAPLDVALGHIAQLKPLLQKHGDVIVALEAGFVGTWGEWWWTSNYNFVPTTTEGYEPRRKLVDALLDALPEDRMVCLRTARHKILSYGLTHADSITIKTAHNGSKLSRLGAHNDCFLASADDWGTYDGGRPDMLFWERETRYVIMGGETCNVDYQYTNCDNTIEQMEKYHWTYLNQNYHTDVLNGWKSGNCYDEVQRRLGYRLVLREGYFTPSPTAGGAYEVALKIANVGFAAPANPRNVQIVFVSEDGTRTYVVDVNDDPRFWFAGQTHTLYAKFDLPSGMTAGKKYNVYLNLPDPKPALDTRPEYSIRLANTGVWDSSKGYNKIHEIQL